MFIYKQNRQDKTICCPFYYQSVIWYSLCLHPGISSFPAGGLNLRTFEELWHERSMLCEHLSSQRTVYKAVFCFWFDACYSSIKRAFRHLLLALKPQDKEGAVKLPVCGAKSRVGLVGEVKIPIPDPTSSWDYLVHRSSGPARWWTGSSKAPGVTEHSDHKTSSNFILA